MNNQKGNNIFKIQPSHWCLKPDFKIYILLYLEIFLNIYSGKKQIVKIESFNNHTGGYICFMHEYNYVYIHPLFIWY